MERHRERGKDEVIWENKEEEEEGEYKGRIWMGVGGAPRGIGGRGERERERTKGTREGEDEGKGGREGEVGGIGKRGVERRRGRGRGRWE